MRRLPFVLYFCCVLLVLPLLTGMVSADGGRILAYAVSGYTGTEEAFAPAAEENASEKILPFTSENIAVSGSYTRTNLRTDETESTRPVLWTYLPGSGSGAENMTVFAIDFTDAETDLTDYSALQFGLYPAGGSASTVELTLVTTHEVATATVYVNGGSWSLVSADLSDVSGTLLGLTVSVRHAAEARSSVIRLTEPTVLTDAPDGFAAIRRFGTDALTAEEGSADTDTGRLIPDEDGRVTVTVSLNPDVLADVSPAFIELRLNGVSSGSVSVGIAETGKGKFTATPSVSLKNGVLLLPLPSVGSVAAYSLSFTKITPSDGFTLESVRFLPGTGSVPAAYPSLGTVSAVTLNGNKLHFSGTAERTVFTDYRGASIVFCALPGFAADSLEGAVELGSIRLSTVFEYTVDLAPFPITPADALFFAALKTEDGTLLPLSAPRCPDAGHAAESVLSVTGLADAATAGGFESNISHVIVDVPLGELLRADSGVGASVSYSLYTADGTENRLLSFDRDLLASLDRDIAFYESAGIRVYLRLCAEEAIPGLTAGGSADHYGMKLTDGASRGEYVAVVRFLARRYAGAAGFVLGYAVNDRASVGDTDLTDLSAYAAALGDCCRLTYNAASSSIHAPLILLPLDAADSADADASALALLIQSRLNVIGSMPWAPLWCTDSADADAFDVPARFSRLLNQLEWPTPSADMILSSPTPERLEEAYLTHPSDGALSYTDYAAELFGSFWDSAGARGYDAAFLSLGALPFKNDHAFYSKLKSSVHAGGAVSDFSAEATDSDGGTLLWDFSDAYHPLGWVAGGGVSSCITDADSRSGSETYTRVLRAAFDQSDPADGIAGIILCDLRQTVDLTDVNSMTFTAALEAPDTDSAAGAQIVFVVGTDDLRAEYVTERLTVGETYRLTCDLTPYEHRSIVDYVGVMVYADSPVELELYAVSADSASLTPEEIVSRFLPVDSDDAEPDKPDYSVIAVIALLTAVISVVLVMALIRRDRETAAHRKAGASAESIRRSK